MVSCPIPCQQEIRDVPLLGLNFQRGFWSMQGCKHNQVCNFLKQLPHFPGFTCPHATKQLLEAKLAEQHSPLKDLRGLEMEHLKLKLLLLGKLSIFSRMCFNTLSQGSITVFFFLIFSPLYMENVVYAQGQNSVCFPAKQNIYLFIVTANGAYL